MPVVAYNASKFGGHWGSALAGSHSLSISWNELVWAAITIGKPGVAFLLAHGWHSVSDLIVRAHMVYANLRLQRLSDEFCQVADSSVEASEWELPFAPRSGSSLLRAATAVGACGSR